jgi:Ca2+/Na+ antiporter
MGLLTLLLVPFSITHARTLTRGEGVALLTIWIAYMALRLALAGYGGAVP